MLAIFHITHVDNLPTIISNGLVCDATASTAGVTRVDIGYSQIKERRARREVSRGPGGLEQVAKDTDRDFILTAEGAVEYGVVDEVITSRKITPELAAVGRGGS